MRPLDGIRILELSTMITASFSAMMLAEQGAEVIKVEPVDLGDPMRYVGSTKGGMSALFANCNRGKRSLALDLKSDRGREAIESLVATTDVVLTNYRPGVMDGLGLGSDHLRSANPRLIYAGVSGFGTEGALRNAPAYDPIVQASTGFAAVQGQGRGEPTFMQSLLCDKITAYTVCQAVTAALFARERTGSGAHIDLSMLDASLYFLFPDGFMHHTLLDDDVEHLPPLSEAAYNPWATADGSITTTIGTLAQRSGFLAAIDRQDLLTDPRFDEPTKVRANLAEYRREIADAIVTFTTAEVLERLHANDVPAAALLDYHEVIAHPQFEANDSIDVAAHAQAGSMRRVKPPVRFDGERSVPASDAPAHGEHTAEIMVELGCSAEEISALAHERILFVADH